MNNLHTNMKKWCQGWQLNELNENLIASIEQSAEPIDNL